MTKSTTRLSAAERDTHIKSTLEELDKLQKRCLRWENQTNLKANEALYKLLGQCLGIYLGRFQSVSEASAALARKELVAALAEIGIRSTKATHTLQLMVRYCFKNDRRRANVYAYVLRAAVEADVSPDDLPTFIRSGGGIEEIRRQITVKEHALDARAKAQDKLGEVEAIIEQNVAQPVGQLYWSGEAQLGQYSLILGVPGDNGWISLVSVLPAAPPKMVGQFKRSIAAGLVTQSDMAALRAAQETTLEPPPEEPNPPAMALAA